MYGYWGLEAQVQVCEYFTLQCFVKPLYKNGLWTSVFAGSNSSYFPSTSSVLLISKQPRPQSLVEGDALCLECGAQANPPAQFQWFHNKQPMPNSTRSILKVSPSVLCYHSGSPFSVLKSTWVESLTLCSRADSMCNHSSPRYIHLQGLQPLSWNVEWSSASKHRWDAWVVSLKVQCVKCSVI